MAGETADGLPRLRMLPWLRVSSFARRDMGETTRLILEGELRVGASPPKFLRLVVAHGDEVVGYRPASVQISRGGGAGRGRRNLALNVVFEIDDRFTEYPAAEFQILANRRQPIDLPSPVETAAQMSAGQWLGLGAMAAALSATTLMAVPARAFAAGGSGRTSTTVHHASHAGGGTGRAGTKGGTRSAGAKGGTGRAGTKGGTRSAGAKGGGGLGGAGAKSGSSRKPSGGGAEINSLKNSGGNPHHSVPAPRKTHPLPPVTIRNGVGVYSNTDIWAGAALPLSLDAELRLQRLADNANHATRPPKYLVRTYERAAQHYRLPWEVLAAINYLDTGYEKQHPVVPARAVRWVRLNRGAWSGSGEGVTRLFHVTQNTRTTRPAVRAEISSLARRLVADGAHTSLGKAVFRHRHTRLYVQEVLTLAERLAARNHIRHQSPQRRLAAMITMAHLLNGMTYQWAGGHTADRWIVQVGYDCSGFVSAVLYAGGYLQSPQSTQTLPGQRSLAKGVGRWVTIFDRTDAGRKADHVIIDLNGRFWEAGGTSQAGVSMVHRISDVSLSYLQTFNVVLHPKGL